MRKWILVAGAAVAVGLLLLVVWGRQGGEKSPGQDGRNELGSLIGPPPQVPGVEATFRMQLPVARAYLDPGEDDPADTVYREALSVAARADARYDWNLSRAARELAAQWELSGSNMPASILAAVLHAHGVPETTAAMLRLSTRSDSPEELRAAVAQALLSPPAGTGPIYVGIGEAQTPGEKFTRRVLVLQVRRPYSVGRASRYAPLFSKWAMRIELPEGFKHPEVVAMHPNGEIGAVKSSVVGNELLAEVDTGGVAGTLSVAVEGIGTEGPTKLVQFSVELGVEERTEYAYTVLGEEKQFTVLADAEKYALELLNRDRARFGRPPLEWDHDLSLIARLHSNEMRANGFFAHLSPTSGLLRDRLAAFGYRASVHAENLARNRRIDQAQATLLASVGHRKNLLDPTFTRVGVGLARDGADEDGIWYLTQVFARPVEALATAEVEANILARLNEARSGKNAGALERYDELDRVAGEWAPDAISGKVEGLANRVGEAAQATVAGRAAVTVQVVSELARYEVPAQALEAGFGAVGIGVAQAEDDTSGKLGIILILAE